MTLANGGGESDVPACDPPASFSVHLASKKKSGICVSIKHCIHHRPRSLYYEIPKFGTYFYNIPGSERNFTFLRSSIIIPNHYYNACILIQLLVTPSLINIK